MKYIEPASAVAFLNHLWIEGRNQETYNTITHAAAYQNAQREFYRFVEKPHDRKAIRAFFKKWLDRATVSGPMTLTAEWRAETWSWIFDKAEEMITYTDELWSKDLIISGTKDGYGLWSDKDGWIITPGGKK